MGAEEDLAAAKKALADAEADAKKWKDLSRKHEDRAKENAAAAEELAQLKKDGQTEQQRREAAQAAYDKKIADLDRKVSESEARALRAEVATAKGLSAAQAKRLAGATREELEADADDILENFKPAGTAGESGTDTGNRSNRPASRPKESLSGGSDPDRNTETVETDPAKLAENLPRY